MAKKLEKSADISAEIKRLHDAKKLVIGTERVMSQLKKGKLSRVFVTSNCPESVKEDLARYAQISDISLVQLEMPNDELGVICKKPFSISVLGVIKG